MKFPRIAALAAGACLASSAALAQTPYVSLEGGWNHTSGISVHGSTTSLNASTTEDEGYLVGGAFGLAWGAYRLELNLDYRNNSVSGIHIGNPGAFAGNAALAAAGPNPSASGTVHALAETINGYMDLPYGMSGFVPYIGAGVGVANLSLAGVNAAGVPIIDDTDTEPALAGIVGVRHDLNDNWSASLQYEFLNAFHPNFRDKTGNQLSTSDYRNSSVMLKISYSFGAPPSPPPPLRPAAAPPPPPPPPMAPAPQAAAPTGPRQVFLVFFDFDKATLTAAGKQVLDNAAAAYRKDQPIRIEVTGYTDTMGTQQYNMRLSQKRADAVRDYLAAKGVPPSRQDVAWKGKQDLRVPTPDAVREPQNRRVEIVLP